MTKSRLVYSSEKGRICPGCGKPVSSCVCKKKKTNNDSAAVRNYPDDGVIRITRETKGHKGKTVTRVGNIHLGESGLKDFARRLKTRCGTGGSIKDSEIIIQGDHRQVILDEIIKQGYRAKLAGG